MRRRFGANDTHLPCLSVDGQWGMPPVLIWILFNHSQKLSMTIYMWHRRKLAARAGNTTEIGSTFYMTEHDTGRHTELLLRRRRANIFTVKMDMLVDFHGYYGGDENPAMAVQAEVDLSFFGLLIIRDKPATHAELQVIAAGFVDLSAYEAPEPWQRHGFIFRPSVERAEQTGQE
jgi:hypothetical protein